MPDPQSPDRHCGVCRFFDRSTARCHRMPPSYVMWAVDNQHPVLYSTTLEWPSPDASDWCGEFQELRLGPSSGDDSYD